jgi:glycosyltransferase involved in cell wall biosynthesis
VTAAPAEVSVVVATYRRAPLLPRLVAALEEQSLAPERFEVVVCDNGSDDDTSAVLAGLAGRSPLRLRVVRTAVNRGPAAGRELAWRAAEAPVLAFTDDDCQPEPGWLAAGLAEMRARGRAVVVGRTVPDPEQEHLLVDFSRTQRVDDARFAQTCNVFYRRADLEASGGFDPGFETPGGEDTDLALRVEALGSPRVHAPAAVVRHDVRPSSLRATLRETLRWYDIPRVYAKHPHARRESLHRRLFWKPSHPPVLLLAAGVGIALARRRPGPLLLAVPWIRFRTVVWPVSGGPRRRWAMLPGALAVDALEVAVMARGSLRNRTVVL